MPHSLGTTENTTHLCLQGETGCPQKATIRLLCSEATGKSAAPATRGQWQLYLWPACGKDHPRDKEPIAGIFGGRDHSSVISLTGSLRGQGLVGNVKWPQEWKEHMDPELGYWIHGQPIHLLPVLRSQRFHQQQHSLH